MSTLQSQHSIPIPHTSITLHAVTNIVSPTAPWLVFSNSLLTNTSLWSHVAPTLTSKGYNLLFHDQRGHGRSSIPAPPFCTMADLADDIADLLNYFGIKSVHAVIGISQGGAAVLQFSLRHPGRSTRIIACDTQAQAPAVDIVSQEEIERAKKDGMGWLAVEIAAQWFPPESPFHPSSCSAESRAVLEMIGATPVLGFEAGAWSLRNYNLIGEGLLESKVKTLLIVGQEDLVLVKGMNELREDWVRQGGDVKFAEIKGSGHIPVLDGANRWLEAVVAFLEV